MKNHLSENVRRMRQIQKQCKQKERETQQPVKVLWKSDKYSGVQSRIKEELEKPPLPPRPHSATFLRAHSRSGPIVKLESRPCTPDFTDKLSVPPASSANDVKLIRHNFDFIKVNGCSAKHSKIQRPPSLTALDELRKKDDDRMADYEFGEVPKYLKHRKEQWKRNEEERIANTPDPSMPPGHRALPENERRETLDLLKKREQELLKELASLPIGVDTARVRNKRKEIEGKLAELEEAVKIFARPKVFVRVDP
ncbi:hypothetical protein C0Q70_00829 [Pomacea canaliculata]|uniref:Enkurin domain-containing protein n=1 Tax=Pomacea canaliculata TaxID=400727 RepID=A0A2T7PXT7_POMCA|nr:enkurin domain-containing protein 1-like [Pomacea canaliculata]PVD38218.1 hypothetical protein C0Q70_00829 [Pomacea canaliculata]